MQRRGAVLVLVVVATLGVASATLRPPLGSLGGVTDEYFELGARLRVNGTLGLSVGEPSALRAPGYPAFVASVLALTLPNPTQIDRESFDSLGLRHLAIAQALLLAAASALLFLWLASRLDPVLALGVAVAFGASPYAQLMVGLSHYSLLHMAMLVPACWLLARALEPPLRLGRFAAAGVFWGLTTLVRPVAVLLPGFLLAALWLRRAGSARDQLRAALVFGGAMLLPLVPWTARNFALNGRLVPVNDNNWATLWGQTARPLPRDPDRYVWFDLYLHDFMPIFSATTGARAYDYAVHVRRIGEVEDAFRAAALDNIRKQPDVYVQNAAWTLRSLLFDPNRALLAAYREMGREPPRDASGVPRVPQSWFVSGQPQPELPGGLRHASDAVFAAWIALGVAGVLVAFARPTAAGTAVLTAATCVFFTHSLVFAHLLHYYVRWPFAAVLAALGLEALARRGPRERTVARAVALLLGVATLAVSFSLL